MHASLVRRQLSGLVPPKIASPTILVELLLLPRRRSSFILFYFLQTAGKGADLSPLVAFYSKLPKGPAPESTGGGIKARYFNGKNASASPIVVTVLAIFGLGYTIDYQSAFFFCFPSSLLTGVSDIHLPLLLELQCISVRVIFFLWNRADVSRAYTEHHKNHAH